MGSGKSTVGRRLADGLGFHFLEVSDVVKSILNSQNRSSLVQESLHKKQEDPMWLAEPLKQQLTQHKNWVVSGVREIVLLDMIRDLGQPVHVIHLTCASKTRLKRCKDKYKTLSELKKADAVDRNLGIEEVINSADLSLSTTGSLKQTEKNLIELVETFVDLD